MGKAQPVLLEHDDAGVDHSVEARVELLVERGSVAHELEPWIGQGGGGDKQRARTAGECRDPVAHDLPEGRRQRQGLAGHDLDPAAFQGSRQLECVEGIAAGRCVDPAQRRARHRLAAVGAEDAAQRPDAERSELQAARPVSRQRSFDAAGWARERIGSTGEEEADRQLEQTSAREFERVGGRGVHPLHVVDRDEKRTLAGDDSQQREERGCDGTRGRWTCTDVRPERHDLERPALRHGQVRRRAIEDRLEQIAQHGKRELGLEARRRRRKDHVPTSPCRRDPAVPERRLADPGVALHDERSGNAADPVEEGEQLCELLVSPDDFQTGDAHVLTMIRAGPPDRKAGYAWRRTTLMPHALPEVKSWSGSTSPTQPRKCGSGSASVEPITAGRVSASCSSPRSSCSARASASSEAGPSM
jgi:hypothetical protein